MSAVPRPSHDVVDVDRLAPDDAAFGPVYELAPKLAEQVVARDDRRTMTLLSYVVRFPPEVQAEMYELFRAGGTRFARNYVECVLAPPSVSAMTSRIARFVVREFPPVPADQLAEALRRVAAVLDDWDG